MQINFKTRILDYAGAEIALTPENRQPLTLGIVVLDALNTKQPNDSSSPGTQYILYALAQRVWAALAPEADGTIEVEVGEVAMLKVRLEGAEKSVPMVVGRCWDILEGKYTEPSEEKKDDN